MHAKDMVLGGQYVSRFCGDREIYFVVTAHIQAPGDSEWGVEIQEWDDGVPVAYTHPRPQVFGEWDITPLQ
jgi:hypothetical protein